MAEIRTVEIVVTGRVQGVGYRAWTHRQAQERGLSGDVRNREDGSVATTFSGDAASVAAMLEACRSGPPGARVDAVAVAERPAGAPAGGFAIRYD